jgi:S1-C subfamily serine protease
MSLSLLRTVGLHMLIIPAIVALPLPADAPDSTRTVQVMRAEPFSIGELGALITPEGNALTVRFVSPPANRKEPYKAVDLREGDAVLMVNGKRVRSIADLKVAYEAVAVGSEVKLGLERGKEMMLVDFPKADPKDLPKMKVMVRRAGDDGGEFFPAVGVALAERGKKVVVREILPIETSAVHSLDVKAGDAILSLNGWTVTSLKAYTEKFDAIPVGGKVEWKTERDGRQLTVSFLRPKPIGNVMIRRGGQ